MPDSFFDPSILIPLFILNFILCFIVGDAWRSKRLGYGAGFALSFFFSAIVGILLGILFQPEYITKVCPSCRESVKKTALVCKYCGFKFGADSGNEKKKEVKNERS